MGTKTKEPSKYSLKKPFIYSETYRRWKTAVISGGADSKLAVELACDHAKKFSYKNKRCEPNYVPPTDYAESTLDLAQEF